MRKVDRRSALAMGLAAASAAVVQPAAAQPVDTNVGKETTLYPGVVQRAYGESPSIIPGFKTVSINRSTTKKRFGRPKYARPHTAPLRGL